MQLEIYPEARVLPSTLNSGIRSIRGLFNVGVDLMLMSRSSRPRVDLAVTLARTTAIATERHFEHGAPASVG